MVNTNTLHTRETILYDFHGRLPWKTRKLYMSQFCFQLFTRLGLLQSCSLTMARLELFISSGCGWKHVLLMAQSQGPIVVPNKDLENSRTDRNGNCKWNTRSQFIRMAGEKIGVQAYHL